MVGNFQGCFVLWKVGDSPKWCNIACVGCIIYVVYALLTLDLAQYNFIRFIHHQATSAKQLGEKTAAKQVLESKLDANSDHYF